MDSQSVTTAAKLREMISGYWISQSIHVAAKLGIADLLKAGSKTSEKLAEETGMQPRALYRLLRLLASVGIFAESEDRHFGLTQLAEPLQSGVAGSLRGWAIAINQEHFHRSWSELLYSVRTGAPAFNRIFDMNCWEYLSRDQDAAAIFNDGLASYTSAVAAAVIEIYDFSQFDRLVDVGGGHGTLITAILKANPKLRGVLFDLPHAMAGARKAVEGAQLADRCETVAGDFFGAVPTGGGAYLLSHIIHDWDDDRAVKILANCRRAMPANGRLLLVEMVIPPGNEAFYGKLLDVNMLVWTDSGTDRTEIEYRDLLTAAGFRMKQAIPTQAGVSVIESIPT
jgi:hypothetical protein